MRRAGEYLLLICAIAGLHSKRMLAQPKTAEAPPQNEGHAARRDGQHDFDFSIGNWKTHISRRIHPLTGSATWVEFEGTSVVRKVWNGRASLGETEADGPSGHIEALSLRLYNPQSQQWSLSYASEGGTTSVATSLSIPTIGQFKDGRGEFFDTEPFNGRNILVRNVWSDITPNSIRFEQAFSEDGGRTWEENWIATDTRGETDSDATKARPQAKTGAPDGPHDFDFEFGTWRTHVKRLTHPLTGSSVWVECNGTTVVRRVWGGKANLVELEADCPGGQFEGLSLRLYNPQSHQWSLNYSNSSDGTLSQPTIGEFKNGRGEFFDQELLNGRAIFVRFVISDITPNSCRFEQAFSQDGGKTWEVNWIADDTRINDDANKPQ